MSETPPKVFISYSHDSKEHKVWVVDLASRLRHEGVDVTLDQWDLSLGEDVAKFMEDSLTNSDRVLLICTENYVRKADAGEGGVAYERMIVTAEIYRDLGTKKFIPVVRQNNDKPTLPKFIGARFYVDLSLDNTNPKFQEEYKKLLCELHQQPAVKKPPLGKSPFAVQPSGQEAPKIESIFIPLSEANAQQKDIIGIYDTAINIARTGDLVAWRNLVKDIRKSLSGSLQQWREMRNLNQIWDRKNPQPLLDEAVEIYAPLFVLALAGVQSGREKFRDQNAVIDEVLNPYGWVKSRPIEVVNIPSFLVFVFQALYGAICLDTDQLGEAVKLGLMKIRNEDDHSIRLFEYMTIIGWPESLGGIHTQAWDYLMNAANRWNWIPKVFGIADDYKVALSAYYMALHILELADTISSGNGENLSNGEVQLYVPVSFLLSLNDNNKNIPQKAYRKLLRSDPRQIWQSLNVTIDDMKKYWPRWLGYASSWLHKVVNPFVIFHPDLVYEHLLEEIDML
jgi:hypothetical protein